MFDDAEQDDGLAWPSYVDFLSAFIIVLIIFVGVLFCILSEKASRYDQTQVAVGNQRERMGEVIKILKDSGIDASIEGAKIYIPLKDKVVFALGCPSENSNNPACQNLPQGADAELNKIINEINAHDAQWNWKQIVIEGRADACGWEDLPPDEREFKNFALSTRRAMLVLKYFHDCKGCPDNEKERIRKGLVLSGLGNKEKNDGSRDQPGLYNQIGNSQRMCENQDERRIDIALDFGDPSNVPVKW